MSFSQKLWQRNLPLYEATLNLPFNQQLANGTLDKQKFCHYVIQDAHYLLGYGKALAICSAKAYDSDAMIFFAKATETAVIVERLLHNGFMQ